MCAVKIVCYYASPDRGSLTAGSPIKTTTLAYWPRKTKGIWWSNMKQYFLLTSQQWWVDTIWNCRRKSANAWHSVLNAGGVPSKYSKGSASTGMKIDAHVLVVCGGALAAGLRCRQLEVSATIHCNEECHSAIEWFVIELVVLLKKAPPGWTNDVELRPPPS